MTRTPAMTGRTPKTAGSGRAGLKRSALKSAQKRAAQGLNPLQAALAPVCSGIRKLARRGGVMRISNDALDVRHPHGMPAALAAFLHRVLRRTLTCVEYARRHTVTAFDVLYALRGEGITVYIPGADWNYGLYSRRSRARAYCARLRAQPVPAQLLAEAAAARADSEVASARGEAQAAAAVEQQQQQRQQQQELQAVEEEAPPAAAGLEMRFEAVAAGEQAAAEQRAQAAAEQAAAAVEQQAAAPSEARSAARREPEPAAAAMELEVPAQQAQQAAAEAEEEQQQQQEAAAAAAAAETELLSPEAQQPAVAGGKGGAAAATAAAAARSRRVSDIPTPMVMTEARALEVQGWMSDVIHGPLCAQGRINRQHLRKVMLGKYGCSAAEVQDVLFALEKQGSVMFEGDEIFPCY